MGQIRAEKTAVIGDVGGHVSVLRTMLEDLGVIFEGPGKISGTAWADIDILWPEGLHVVQLGDLVHRGPDSPGVVVLVDKLIRLGHWTQLAGNHEQLYVDRPVFGWHESIDQQAVDLLRSWWAEGKMTAAAYLATPTEDWLVTHAGLTQGFWEYGLLKPASTHALLKAIKEATEDGAIWNPGTMLTGDQNYNAGPIWAAAGDELYSSWLDASEQPGFNQIHGHSSAYDWRSEKWWATSRIRRACTLDPLRQHVSFTAGKQKLVGIDPCHGSVPAAAFAPFVLECASIYTS